MTAALAAWRRAVELLPSGTVQRQTIDARMQALSRAIDGRGPAPAGVSAKSGGGAKAAGVGAVGLALLKSKALLTALLANGKLLLLGLAKAPTLFSMLLYMRWASGRGVGVGLGIVACMYVHEVGHVAALRRYGIDASAPMFVPGLGALVRLKQYPTDAHEEARTGLAGPLWGLVASVCAAALGKALGSDTVLTVASWSATLNLFNLIPFWQLDGARGLKALSKGERLVVVAVAGAMALAAHSWLSVAVALFALPRAFQRDAPMPGQGDRGMLALFAFLIVALAAFATVGPGALPTQ